MSPNRLCALIFTPHARPGSPCRCLSTDPSLASLGATLKPPQPCIPSLTQARRVSFCLCALLGGPRRASMRPTYLLCMAVAAPGLRSATGGFHDCQRSCRLAFSAAADRSVQEERRKGRLGKRRKGRRRTSVTGMVQAATFDWRLGKDSIVGKQQRKVQETVRTT